VQLFGRERAAEQQFGAVNDHYLSAHLRSITYYALFFPIIRQKLPRLGPSAV
jgi:hypothetical protein